MANSWSMGLVKTILEPKNLIISSECAVVIADKYPKARHHYLVLPTTDIPTIFHLNKGHIPLLDELLLLAHNIVELRGEKLTNFKVGFHAEPSMQRLHLHVISKDFVSPFLKTKKHWNSFNTDLFIPYEHIYKQIQMDGEVKRLAKEEVQSLLSTPLLCNQCTLEAKNMPALKNHLELHLEKNTDRGLQTISM